MRKWSKYVQKSIARFLRRADGWEFRSFSISLSWKQRSQQWRLGCKLRNSLVASVINLGNQCLVNWLTKVISLLKLGRFALFRPWNWEDLHFFNLFLISAVFPQILSILSYHFNLLTCEVYHLPSSYLNCPPRKFYDALRPRFGMGIHQPRAS